MASKASLVVAGAEPASKPASRILVPNRESEGLTLALEALKDGEIVSSKGLSKEAYIARARARNGK